MKLNWKLIIIHILLWMLYILIWGFMDMIYAPTFWDTVDGNIIGSLSYCPGIYINMYFLIPYFLLENRRVLYVFLLTVLILANSYFSAQIFSYYYLHHHIPTSEFFASMQGMGSTGSEFLIILGFSMCFYFINQWYVKERRLRELESTNLRVELDLLKGQINPHFLFNALNSIHVLIRKDNEKAIETLEKFSDLLSHQIYDVKKEWVPLETEIKNLSNFIQLQELRFSNHVNVQWQVNGEPTGLKVPPMLFLNFVENAFKHGVSNKEEMTKVEVLLDIRESYLEFSCINSVTDEGLRHEGEGLGLSNVRRRLELLYPGKHQLEIEKNAQEFSVNLQINLNGN
ncbi:sensor histidine kinase [Roseivirga sp.]|uniref:sensor histidine kinase n=1 Tax=Roseivirga sp. TaxID=1964215 RepID=UPI003B51F44A